MHDTHAHLDILCEHLDLIQSIDTTLKPNVISHLDMLLANHDFVIQPTCSFENFNRAYRLFNKKLQTELYFLLGAHPEIVTQEFDCEVYMKQLKYFDFTQIIGIGEIGLDYHYTQDQAIISKQKQLFKLHIELAINTDKPIVIHCREAFDDLFTILDEYPQIHGRFLIHCFTGGVGELQEVLKRGGLVAYGGVITFKNSLEVQVSVVECPISSFVLETDLPYLAPAPNRGKICKPEYIDDTAKQIALFKNITLEELWINSKLNTINLFNLAKSS